MTLDSNLSKAVYQGNGSTTVFPFAFKVWNINHIAVTVTDAAGVSTDVTSNSTVALTSSGGSVTYPKTGSPLPTGAKLAITRNMPFTQGINLTTASRFDPQVLEDGLDQATAERQQVLEQMARAVILPATSSESPEDVVATIYASRDAAAASANAASAQATAAAGSATAAANSASTAAQTVESATDTAVAAATTQANAAATSAAAAAQSALDAAAAVPDNLVGRVTATEIKNTDQDTRLDDVEGLVAALIGSVQSVMATDSYVPNGCVPANGAEYTRAQFSSLYDTYLAEGKLLTCTYAAWAAQVGLTGNCAKFALDTVNQKFKVPLLKDGDSITQAASSVELGKSVKAGLPDASGTLGLYISGATLQLSTTLTGGAITRDTSSGGIGATSAVNDPGAGSRWKFRLSDGNPIYRDDVTTVLDEQVRLRHFVVVASAQNSASVFDWSNYMAALAGKANVDLSNATGNAMRYYFMARDEKASGTSGGATSAGSVMTRDINTIKVNTIGATLTSNRITLPAGRYIIKAIMPAIGTNSTRAVLYDYTHSAYLEYGQNVYSSSALAANCLASVEADVTFASDTQIEVRMYTGAANANGCGVATSIPGVVEVYTKVEIWKL